MDPSWVGGLRHLADVFSAYSLDPKADPEALLEELRRSGSGAAAKRLGYLAENLWPVADALIAGAHAARSTGVVKLDPALARRGKMNSRWGLWINVSLGASGAHA